MIASGMVSGPSQAGSAGPRLQGEALAGPALHVQRPRSAPHGRHLDEDSDQPDPAAAFAALMPEPAQPVAPAAAVDPNGSALTSGDPVGEDAELIDGPCIAAGPAAPDWQAPSATGPGETVAPQAAPSDGPAGGSSPIAVGAEASAMQSLLEGLAAPSDGSPAPRDHHARPLDAGVAKDPAPAVQPKADHSGPDLPPADLAAGATVQERPLADRAIRPDAASPQPAAHNARLVIAQILPHAAQARHQPVEIELSPEGLGRVRFHILHQGNAVQVVLAAERADTADLLRRNADQLAQEFRQSGLQGAQIDFGGWSGQRGDQRPSLPVILAPDPATRDRAEMPSGPPGPQPRRAAVGLDLRL